jgi:hypothetical protein
MHTLAIRPAFSLAGFFRLTVIFCVAALGGWSLLHARAEVSDQNAFAIDLAQVKVVPPDTAPAIGQKSIDIAIVMFGITIPADADYPTYDSKLNDRGLTTKGVFMQKATVTIGPAAFTSWSLLGSTLAHELEVHCNQNLLFISLLDALHLDGTGEAERQAYIYELRNSKRFGLNIEDADLIASTMEFYYPDSVIGTASAPVKSVQKWLAKNLLLNQKGF